MAHKGRSKKIAVGWTFAFIITAAFIVGFTERDQVLAFEFKIPEEQLRTVGSGSRGTGDTGCVGFCSGDTTSGSSSTGTSSTTSGSSTTGTTTSCVWWDIFCNQGASSSSTGTSGTTSGSDTTPDSTTDPDTTDTTQSTDDGTVSIFCAVRQETDILDADGNTISTAKGPFLLENPIKLTFIDTQTQKEIEKGGFLSKLLIKCQSSESEELAREKASTTGGTVPQGTFGVVPSTEIPITIDQSNLDVRVYSVDDINSQLVETYNGKFNTEELKLTDSKEKQFGTHNIKADRILVFIPDGSYSSWQHFAVEGTINLHLTDNPDEKYSIRLATQKKFTNSKLVSVENSVMNYRQIQVDKKTDEPPPEPSPQDCTEGQILVNNICTTQKKPTEQEPNVTPTDYFGKLTACFATQGPTCLIQSQYIPLTVAGVGFLFLIGAVTHNSGPKFDQFGNRVG